MWRKIILQIILFVLAASVTSAQSSDTITMGDVKKTYKLTGEWNFKPIDQMAYASPDYDDSGWDRVPVPGQWHVLGIKHVETAWYRRKVFIQKNFMKTPISILAPTIADAHELYFNGIKVGCAGIISPDGSVLKKSSQPGIYVISPDIINYDGDNLIAVRVCDDVGWGGFVNSRFFIGSTKMLTQKFLRNIMWKVSISFVLIFLGAYYLILFLGRHKEIVYFYYALFSTTSGLTLVGTTGLTYLIIDNFWFNHFVLHTGLNILAVLALLLIYTYFKYKRDLIFKIFITVYILLFSVLLMTPLHLSILRFYGIVTLTFAMGLNIVTAVWITILIVKSVIMKKMGANIVAIGSLLGILALTNDLLCYLKIIQTDIFLLAEGFIIFIISISIDMAFKYAKLYDALQIAQEKIIEKERMEHEIKLAAEVQQV